jgi:CRISPR-associated endonuclease Cas2
MTTPSRLWIITYDVAQPKRLRRTAQACEQHAVRAQESVFEAVMDARVKRNIGPALSRHMNHEEDSMIWHPQCTRCQRGSLHLGGASVARTAGYWIV